MALAAVTLCLAGGTGAGQTPRPAGPEFVVNADSANDQFAPAVSAASDGRFVVAWLEIEPDPPNPPGYYFFWVGLARRFEAGGTPAGADQELARRYTFPTPAGQSAVYDFKPSVAPDGRFVVAYESSDSYYAESFLFARRFDAQGVPIGSVSISDDALSTANFAADLGRGTDGRFVVAWQTGYGYGSHVVTRHFTADGIGEPGLPARVDTADLQVESPAVAKAANDDYLVVWTQRTPLDGREIVGRKFAGDGMPLTGEVVVNELSTGDQASPEVAALADGGFAVVWVDRSGRDGSFEGVFGRKVDADGTPTGADFPVNTSVFGNQNIPEIVGVDPGFAVAWTDQGGADGSGRGVFLRTFRLDGTPASGDVVVPSQTLDHQSVARVARTGDDLTLVWQTETGGPSGLEIAGRRFVVPLFDDGFESGDTSAWSAAVP